VLKFITQKAHDASVGLFSEEDIIDKQISSRKTDHRNFMVMFTSIPFKT